MTPELNELISTAHSPITDPQLHAWGWEIPVYLFLGGWTAGLLVLCGWALWKGKRNGRPRATFSLASSGLFVLGLAAISAGMLALFLAVIASPYLVVRHLHTHGTIHAKPRAPLHLLRKHRGSSGRLGSPQPRGVS